MGFIRVPAGFFILVICWAYLVYIAYPPRIQVLGDGIEEEIARLGKITNQERKVLAVVTLTLFLTEITSNTATATIILPVTFSLASVLGMEPAGLMIAAAMSSSLAFMLPVATPPNAIVFGTGSVTISQIARAGLWVNILCITIITLFITFKPL